MSHWEAFKKYFGVRGVLAIMLVGGYIYFTAKGIPISETYSNLTFGIIGLFLGRNGVSVYSGMRSALGK